jgi:signal transduction histidine kinase
LLLSVILIPTAAVILLVFRVVGQENELSRSRASEQRREALDQLRRELTARLQALRLAEVNRLIGEPGRRLPADSPIVFVAPIEQDALVLPWEPAGTQPRSAPAFLHAQRDGEAREFRQNDAAGAVASYRQAVEIARAPTERCAARLALGRAYQKAAMPGDANATDNIVLQECDDVADADGVPLALYAAARRMSAEPSNQPAGNYVLRRAAAPRWRSPNEALMLHELLRRIDGLDAAERLHALTLEIHSMEQISAFAHDMHDRLGKLDRASRSAPGDLSWIGYGDEPWLLTVVSPASFAAPVLMAVSSRRIVPEGVALRVTPGEGTVALGNGFVDLNVEWAPGRFDIAPAVPAVLYGSMALVLGAALLAGCLLLRDVHREAATADMRSQFVASVSHELKTPLTSIRAHAETLLMGRSGGTEVTSDYLRTIVSESERLTRLVESVLEFSRIEQGRKTYHLQRTQLEEVVRSAAGALEHQLAQLGFTLTITSDGSAPTLLADPGSLTQAIVNLLGNALKYSGDARSIEVRLGTRDGEAFVDVVDHGIGIAGDEQTRIFERFHRVRSFETAGIAGTGLGLPLARHVVEAHHGRIAVVSRPGQGSTFSVSIPLQAQG